MKKIWSPKIIGSLFTINTKINSLKNDITILIYDIYIGKYINKTPATPQNGRCSFIIDLD